MKATIPENLVHIVILDISGVYTQIHNDGYFDEQSLDCIKKQYSNKNKWRIILI